MIYNTK